MKRLLVILVLALLKKTSGAQNSIQYISLDDAITASVSYNDATKLSELQVRLAEAKVRQTDAIFLPQAIFSYAASTTNNSLNAFAFKLQQQSISATDFNPKSLNNPSATADYSAKVELRQPLVNIDMLYQRKAAAIQVEVHQLISSRTKDYLRFETKKAYLQLQMGYDEYKVLNEALATSQSVYKNSRDYYDQGLIQKSDLLNAELHVMNIQTLTKNIRSGIEEASDALSLLMGRPTGTTYTADSITLADTSITDNATIPGERSDFRAMEKGMESYDMMIKSSKMSYLPTLNAFASWQSNDKNIFAFNANSYFAGVQFSWKLFNGNRTKSTISQLGLEKEIIAKQLDQQKKEAHLQINHSRRELSDASFLMRQQQLAVFQASEALRILRDRYEQGLVKTSDVLAAQTQLSEQKIGYVHAVFKYNLAAASLEFLLSTK